MKVKHTKVATLAATLITFGSLAGGANGALVVNITEMNSTSFSWNITGDFSGLATPTSGLDDLNILFYDTSGSLMTTIVPTIQAPVRPTGGVNGGSYLAGGWLFNPAGSGNTYSQPIVGNTADRFVFADGGSFSVTDVITAPITSNGSGLYTGLDWTGFDQAVVVWGNNLVPPPASIPEPSSSILLALGSLGIVALRRRTQ